MKADYPGNYINISQSLLTTSFSYKYQSPELSKRHVRNSEAGGTIHLIVSGTQATPGLRRTNHVGATTNLLFKWRNLEIPAQ